MSDRGSFGSHLSRGLEKYVHWLLLAPALGLIAFVVAIPLGRALYVSLTNYELLSSGPASFVGFGNFRQALADLSFQHALPATVYYVGATTFGSMLLGLGLALLVERLPEQLQFIRAMLLCPWIMPPAVVALLFLYMFDIRVGVVNAVLAATGVVPPNVGWLSTGSLAMIVVIVASVWLQAPVFALFSAAGLKAIPQEIHDAAAVDGAHGWRLFAHITLPLLARILVTAALLLTIQNLNSFSVIYGLTQGGPVDATTTTTILIYRLAFEDFRFGYASAIGVLILAVMLAPAIVYVRRLRQSEQLGLSQG